MPSTTTKPFPDVPLPPGAVDSGRDRFDASDRFARDITDHDLVVQTSACQYTDGHLDEVHVSVGGDPLNSDQARELASALLEAADELDRWAGRCTAIEGSQP
jgi:hypothetical protein